LDSLETDALVSGANRSTLDEILALSNGLGLRLAVAGVLGFAGVIVSLKMFELLEENGRATDACGVLPIVSGCVILDARWTEGRGLLIGLGRFI
jgi:predicted homoserine dehydrogenase-like protein